VPPRLSGGRASSTTSKPLNSATAFVWWQGQQYYLITNWHVVTGRNHQTGALETIVRPDALHAQFNLATGTFGKRQLNIRIRDEEGRPLWLVYPVQNHKIDVRFRFQCAGTNFF
jgi:hypothetical protein